MKSEFTLKKLNHYDGFSENFDNSKWIFFGAPFDGTSSYRKGSRYAPYEVRKETVLSQETYSPYFESDISEKSICDAGDLILDEHDAMNAISDIKHYTDYLISQQKHPFMMGGEHLVSLPVIESLYSKYPDLRIIQLDAHADMIDILFGEKFSHGTVMRRVSEIIGSKKIYQFGIRSGSKEELTYAKEKNHCQMFDLSISNQWLDELNNYPIYLTVDLDCFDPSQIPGTGTPETGGVFFNDFILFLKKINHLNFVGIDVNELSPRIDPTSMSTIFASKIIREIIAGCL